jgi:Arc/MetJ-type ribon-helix-helix transcriptional regulator
LFNSGREDPTGPSLEQLGVSLPEGDVEFLDSYAERAVFASRSAVLHQAVRMLRASELVSAYEDAWAEWVASDDSAGWDATTADGLADAKG